VATTLTSQIITNEALLQFENTLVVAKHADWQYSAAFAKTSKIGQTQYIRIPVLVQVQVNNLSYPNAATAGTVAETQVALQIGSTLTAPMTFSDTDMSFRIEDFSERFIKNVVEQMAAMFDLSICDAVSNAGVNYFNQAAIQLGTGATAAQYSGVAGWVVGDYGVAITSDVLLNAKQLLDDASCPKSQRYGVLSPKAMRQIAAAQITLFNSTQKIAKMYDTGELTGYAGIAWSESQSCTTHTNGAQGTLAVGAGSVVLTTGWAETGALTVTATAGAIKAGDVFTVAGVYAVNRLTGVTTANLQQFTAIADCAIGVTSVPVSPCPITGGAYKNISTTVASKTATLVGSTGGIGQESFVFHKNAIALAAPELETPGGKDRSQFERSPDTGVAIRYIREYDSIGAAPGASGAPGWVTRLDMFFGCKIVRPEWVVRIRN
jgi:hypothetical protein